MTQQPNTAQADNLQIIPWVIDADMIREGGRAGGAYLESIGVFDLSKLTREQYQIFCAKIVAATLPDSTPLGMQPPPF